MMDMPSHRSRSISISASPNDLNQLQSSALDDSKQDHPLISNSVTTDSTYREDHSAQRGEEEDDGRRVSEDHDYHDDGVSNIPSRDDADLINDIMNQKSSDEDYDFKLVETMDEDDVEQERGMHPSDGRNQPVDMPATMTSSTTEAMRGMHSNITSGASSQASNKVAAGKMPLHTPKLELPHQIAALEKKNQVEQPHHYSVSNTNNPNWHSKHLTRETRTTSSYMYEQAGYYHNFHPLPPSSSTDQMHSTQSSIETHQSKKRLLHVNDPDDSRAGGRYPVVVNMKRNKINDPNEGDVKNNVSEKANSVAPYPYDPYNCVNHMQPHYTAPSTTNGGGEHRRNWSSCSTASSISAGGLSSSLSSSTSFDKSGQPFETKAMQNNDHMFGGQQQSSNLSQSSASYSKFDLLSMEDTSAISNRMFTANGKPFSTSPIMGAGSNSTASTVSSIAVGKKHQMENLNANGNNKLDPGVTPISKNTRRDRAAVPLRHPHQHAHTFFAETPAVLSSAHNLTNATNNQLHASNLIGEMKQRSMISVDVRESRDAPSSQELYRQNSFTPIPMNSSGDDIDDVHNMTIQPNLSWSLMGETSPLGEIDGLDPWSASVASKDPWSRGSAHDILCTLSPNSDTGLKSPCLSNVFDQPHPEERENFVKRGGQHHSYHHQQPHQSFPSSQTHNVSQPPHRYSQHDPHSSQSHNTFVNISGRSPMKTNYQQESIRRHIPPPTPMGSGWSSNHYIPPVTSSNHPPGIDHSNHVKSNNRSFMNGMPSHNYSVDIRDDVNSSRGENFFNSQIQHSFRPSAGGGGDRVINLRGRPMPSHHGSHHPPPSHHYESSHQAPPPLPPHHHHHHHYPGSNRSPWGGRQVPAGGAHPNHSYHHLPTTASHSHMAPSSSQPVAGAVDTVHSRRKCAPLKPPIPSKFQGDIEKNKDATVPEFTSLVNYPTNVANKMAAMAGDGLKICVMCGSACPCSSLPKGKCKGGGSDKDEGRALMQHHKQPPNAHKLNGTASSAQGCYAIIPTQNKGLCTFCDVNVWVVIQSGLEIKWCKGCKNFRPWAAFGDKGLATKCVRCRDRQREKYALQKEEKEKTRGDEISVIAEI